MFKNESVGAIIAMCLAMALFIINDASVKLASLRWEPPQIIFVRGLLATILAVGALALTGGLRQIAALRHPLVLLRCGLEGLIALTYIGALARMPIADVTAIFMISPILITVAGALFLGEDVRWRRWTAALVGFAGMLIVVNPGAGEFNLGVVLVLVSTVGAVARDLITRRLPADIPSGGVTIGTIIVTMLMGGAGAAFRPWVPVDADMLPLITLAAVTVAAGNFMIILAFRHGEVSLVSPFRYTLIVWSVLAGVLVFGEWPRPVAWIGIALIVGSGLYTLRREQLRRRMESPQPEKHSLRK
jgi:drug/metabolite transporter (DMT)-like permease